MRAGFLTTAWCDNSMFHYRREGDRLKRRVNSSDSKDQKSRSGNRLLHGFPLLISIVFVASSPGPQMFLFKT